MPCSPLLLGVRSQDVSLSLSISFILFLFVSLRKLLLVGLRALIRLCTDLGLKEASDYASELRKLEHVQSEMNQETRRTSTGIGAE